MKPKFNIQPRNVEEYWVDQYIGDNLGVNYINGILPNLYSNYFKLFLPIGLKDKDGFVKQIKYVDLARKVELEFTNSFSFTSLLEKFNGLPSNFEILKEKDEEFINTIIEICGSETETTFVGYGDDIAPEEFEQEWFIEDKLEIFKKIFKQLNRENYHEYNYFPNLIYPKNKEWCLATIIFQSGLLVFGCNNSIAEKIKKQKVIDYVEIGYTEKYFDFFLTLKNSLYLIKQQEN